MTLELITGTHDTVLDHTLAAARAGDHRARPAVINGHHGILTPHTTPEGHLDAHDLAAQVYALTLGVVSVDGAYTGGFFIAEGLSHVIYAPDSDGTTPQDDTPPLSAPGPYPCLVTIGDHQEILIINHDETGKNASDNTP